MEKADAVITLGGDGTILSVAPAAARLGLPVLGVNIGRLGFMTAVEVRGLYSALSRWLAGRWAESRRTMLEITMPGVRSPQLALNDAVVRIGSTTRVTTIQASVGDEDIGYFVGDGVIVATSTGSTAYSLAAQGPVMHPGVDALLLTPICAHSFSQRPIVFPADMTVRLTLTDQRRGNEVQLCLDGQRVYSVKPGDQIHIRRAPYKLKLLQDPGTTYFGVLREKLSWGER